MQENNPELIKAVARAVGYEPVFSYINIATKLVIYEWAALNSGRRLIELEELNVEGGVRDLKLLVAREDIIGK
jgi:hypothetical protein